VDPRRPAWRLLLGAVHADLRRDYYGIGGTGDSSLPLNQTTTNGLGEELREVAGNLYAGVRLMAMVTRILADHWPAQVPPGLIPPDLGIESTLLSFAPRMVYNTRDNEFYRTAGDLVEAQVQISAKALGSDADYRRSELSWNHYRAAGPAGVLALRLVGKYTSGDAPFFLYPAFGQSGDLRGYTPGTYRNRLLVAAQAGYRLRVRQNLGVVVFAGVGGAWRPWRAGSIAPCPAWAPGCAMSWPRRTMSACASTSRGAGTSINSTSVSARRFEAGTGGVCCVPPGHHSRSHAPVCRSGAGAGGVKVEEPGGKRCCVVQQLERLGESGLVAPRQFDLGPGHLGPEI
jgi:hypothetical protein